jgi:hypothetical protein
MQAFRFFDPWTVLENSDRPSTAAKAVNSETATPQSLATLADLAPASSPSSNTSPQYEELRRSGGEGAAIVKSEKGIPPIGIPEIPDVPVLLRDGRRLWRFPSAEDCAPDKAAALINEARHCGAVLVADGRELIVVERWLSCLPVETLCELRRYASGTIAVLRWSAPRSPSAPKGSR